MHTRLPTIIYIWQLFLCRFIVASSSRVLCFSLFFLSTVIAMWIPVPVFGSFLFTYVCVTMYFYMLSLFPNVVGGSFHGFSRQGHARGGAVSPALSDSSRKRYEEEMSRLTELIKEKQRMSVSWSLS